MEQDARARVRARIQERKGQAIERGLVRDAWDVVIEEGRERGFGFTRGDLEVNIFPGSGTVEVAHKGRLVLVANGSQTAAGVYTYLPAPDHWEKDLRVWADACRFAQRSRAQETNAQAWATELNDRWALTPSGHDLADLAEDLRGRHDSPIALADWPVAS